MNPLLPVHITAGLIGIGSGLVAMYALKGGSLHRRSGTIFVYAMLVMASSAAVMSLLGSQRLNMSMGLLTLYMVTTGLLTVRRRGDNSRRVNVALMLMAVAVGGYLYSLGFEAAASTRGTIDGLPPEGAFVFGSVALFGALGDARMIRSGALQGARRIRRHLWRLCFATFVATGSFFLGQPQVFPPWLRGSAPIIFVAVLPLLVMFYWLARMKFRRPRIGSPLAAATGS
jgi:uncharacterized membrane protein